MKINLEIRNVENKLFICVREADGKEYWSQAWLLEDKNIDFNKDIEIK